MERILQGHAKRDAKGDVERTLQENADRLIKDINTLILRAIENKQTNEQWFLNFLDQVNKLSISF